MVSRRRGGVNPEWISGWHSQTALLDSSDGVHPMKRHRRVEASCQLLAVDRSSLFIAVGARVPVAHAGGYESAVTIERETISRMAHVARARASDFLQTPRKPREHAIAFGGQRVQRRLHEACQEGVDIDLTSRFYCFRGRGSITPLGALCRVSAA
jgi:hypothetical protein